MDAHDRRGMWMPDAGDRRWMRAGGEEMKCHIIHRPCHTSPGRWPGVVARSMRRRPCHCHCLGPLPLPLPSPLPPLSPASSSHSHLMSTLRTTARSQDHAVTPGGIGLLPRSVPGGMQSVPISLATAPTPGLRTGSGRATAKRRLGVRTRIRTRTRIRIVRGPALGCASPRGGARPHPPSTAAEPEGAPASSATSHRLALLAAHYAS